VNAAFSDFGPAGSADGLTMYFTSFNRTDPPQDIFVATRSDMADHFGDIQSLGPPVNSQHLEGVGSISPNEKTLYFDSNRPGGIGDSNDIYQATRENIGDPFDNVTSLGPGVNSSFHDGAPRVTPDGKVIVFDRDEIEARDIWMARRGSIMEPFGDATRVLATEYADWFPSISADKLTLFLSDWVFDPLRPGSVDDSVDIWVSTRASEDDPFGPPVNLNAMWPGTAVNTASIEGVPYISPDWPARGSILYYASNELTGELVADIFQATWVPEPATWVITMMLVLLVLPLRFSTVRL
jgi:Tol biopolymer transport system component